MDIQVIMDTPKYHGRQLWCHMTSNDIETLHRMAKDIGLKREWYQDKEGHPHYDIKTGRKRKLAVDLGAEFVTQKQYLLKVIEWHRKPSDLANDIVSPIPLLNFYDEQK